MKVAVCGLWHLGCVTAACVAQHFDVIAYDDDAVNVGKLKQHQPPIFEPDLQDAIAVASHAKKLVFTTDAQMLQTAEIVWMAFDTPVDDDDQADAENVVQKIIALLPHINAYACVLISSQLPVGTTRKLKKICEQNWPEKKISFAYSPENLRLGQALKTFEQPLRVVIGIDQHEDKTRLENLFAPFTKNILWMSLESAEMSKHAINAFLAASVVFINEVATLCEAVGASALDVEKSLKSESRIGDKAYLHPGAALGGGTLIRDVQYLIGAGQHHQTDTPFLNALLTSNRAHRTWAAKRILQVLDSVRDKKIAVLGLTYKPGTNTLRRSIAIEVAQFLATQGAHIRAYDPQLQTLPDAYAAFIDLKTNLDDALQTADAVMIATDSPAFAHITAAQLLAHNAQPMVFDASGLLQNNLSAESRIQYFSVGR